MKDKIALIIGGASGIGAATTRLLARAGAKTIVAALVLSAEVEGFCDELMREGYSVQWMGCDVTDRSGVKTAFAAVLEQFGRLDIVINSAGVFFPTPVLESDPTTIDALIRVNLLGGINVVQEAVCAMRPRGGGVVVTVTSTQTVRAEPGCAVYAATKAAIAHYVASIAPEMRSTGIRAVCVAPGGTRTPMTAALHESTSQETRDLIEGLNRSHGGPYGEFFLEAEHVAQVVFFAASDAAKAIQGTSIVADQGHTSALAGLPGLDMTVT
jgi:3-oxoacyl-[acyl-carrier protein] reductase